MEISGRIKMVRITHWWHSTLWIANPLDVSGCVLKLKHQFFYELLYLPLKDKILFPRRPHTTFNTLAWISHQTIQFTKLENKIHQNWDEPLAGTTTADGTNHFWMDNTCTPSHVRVSLYSHWDQAVTQRTSLQEKRLLSSSSVQQETSSKI